MAVAYDKFVELLLESGLVPRAELEALVAIIPSADKTGAELLAREIVKRKKLTAYQAKEIYAGRGKKLILGNYLILDKLGQGGMGMVLKAEHKRMERIVALKVMSKAAVESPDAVKRFHREVKAAAKLSHPNIVTAHDADEAAGTHFLVMEFVQGTDLSQLVKKSGPLSVDKALHCILQAARGLDFAHCKGVIHRDIKPANLLIDNEGTVKILDMGLARVEHTAEQAELTGTGQIMGTVDYMAPEQAMNTKTADARADIYSLGITLWYLLTARPAYNGETLMEKLMAHATAPIPNLQEVRQEVPAALEAAFQRMIAKTPGERFQSMKDVIAALGRCRVGRDDVSPTIDLPRCEEFQLGELLQRIGGSSQLRDASSPAAKVPPRAAVMSAVASNTSAEPEATIVTKTPQADTDPQTQNTHSSQANSRTAGNPPESAAALQSVAPSHPWWLQPTTLTVGGSGSILLLVLLAWWIFGSKGDNEVVVKEEPFVGTQSAAATIVENNALEFAWDRVNYVEVPTFRFDRKGTYTIEAQVISTGNRNGEPLSYRQNIFSTLQSPCFLLSREGHNSISVQLQDGQGWQQVNHFLRNAGHFQCHVAGVWSQDTLTLFVNGALVTSNGSTGTSPFDRPEAKGARIGCAYPGGDLYSGPWSGRIDELRISTKVRYEEDFEPPLPSARFINDGDTLALYHFDEGQGETLFDSSGHNHHGKIFGAKWVRVEVPGPQD